MKAVAGPDNAMTANSLQEHSNGWFLNQSMGKDYGLTPEEIEYMAAQEKFKPAFLLNASVGKSWYIDRKYNFGFSLEIKNINNDNRSKEYHFYTGENLSHSITYYRTNEL